MKPFPRPGRLLFATLTSMWCLAAPAQEAPPGAFAETLLAIAKKANPQYTSMRFEGQAAAERITLAGVLLPKQSGAQQREKDIAIHAPIVMQDSFES